MFRTVPVWTYFYAACDQRICSSVAYRHSATRKPRSGRPLEHPCNLLCARVSTFYMHASISLGFACNESRRLLFPVLNTVFTTLSAIWMGINRLGSTGLREFASGDSSSFRSTVCSFVELTVSVVT